MSLPRFSTPGGTYMVTRTTANSLFLLAPSKVTNGIFEYCLARAAGQFGVLIHAVSVESNHYHMIVTDVRGELSECMQELNRTIARCLTKYLKQRYKRRIDTVWTTSQSFSAQLLVDRNMIIKKIAYVLTNPVKDGLVRDYRKWPGFNTRPGQWLQEERTAERPAYYFKRTDERIAFRVVAPRQLGDDLEVVTAAVEEYVRDEQAGHLRTLEHERRSFLGVKRVLAVDPFSAPTTPRPEGNLNPHLAASTPQALQLAIKALRHFRLAYREAWEAFKRGEHAVFPGGTLLMRKRFKVPCDPCDTASWCELACA